MAVVAGVDSSTQSCKVELRRLDDGALGVIEHVALAHLDAITESLGKDRRPATDRPFGRQAAR